MDQRQAAQLLVFLAVAKERSFTKAAAQLGLSPSALSHTIRKFEAGLGIQLLTRTTRSVSPTFAGERLLQEVIPLFEGIETKLEALNELRDKPAGTIRITADELATNAVLWPRLKRLLPSYPDIKIEISIQNGMSDIVSERYDAGIRLGSQIAHGMIAVRASPDIRSAVVGAPSYFARNEPPVTPSELTDHSCINLRLPTYGGFYPWEFEKSGRRLRINVTGQLAFNSNHLMIDAARAGLGLAFLPEDTILQDLHNGNLVSVLEDWCPIFPGWHIYYASGRDMTPAFRLVIDILRYREPQNTST